jgi:hypothetical protein
LRVVGSAGHHVAEDGGDRGRLQQRAHRPPRAGEVAVRRSCGRPGELGAVVGHDQVAGRIADEVLPRCAARSDVPLGEPEPPDVGGDVTARRVPVEGREPGRVEDSVAAGGESGWRSRCRRPGGLGGWCGSGRCRGSGGLGGLGGSRAVVRVRAAALLRRSVHISERNPRPGANLQACSARTSVASRT